MKKAWLSLLPNRLSAAFSWLFFISFSLIFFNIVFNKEVYDYKLLPLLALLVGAVVLMLVIGLVAKKNEQFLEKHWLKIIVFCAIILFSVQMFFIEPLRFSPMYDLEAVYAGAIEWAEGRDFTEYYSDTCHSGYFYIFPNNLGTLSFFAVLFKLAGAFGITDYFCVAAVTNSLLSAGALFLTALLAKKISGSGAAVITSLLFLLSPPFYFIAPVFYTDSLSLIFPPAALLLILIAREQGVFWRKILIYCAAALVCFFGALIKMTVLIVLIAAAIYYLLARRFKELVSLLAVSVVVLCAAFSCFNGIIYSKYLDREMAKQYNTPILYWLDLAFHGDGGYDQQIFELSVFASDPETRKEILTEDIKSGIENLGPSGVLKLFARKSARAFGDGTYALSDFLDDQPKTYGALQKWLTYDGENYEYYSLICTALFLAMQIFMLCSAGLKGKPKEIIILQLSVFGIMFFLLFWEINSRYITTFVPLIFICAASGINRVVGKFYKKPRD